MYLLVPHSLSGRLATVTKAWSVPSIPTSRIYAKRSKTTRYSHITSKRFSGLVIVCARSARFQNEPPLDTAYVGLYHRHTVFDFRGGRAGELKHQWRVPPVCHPT